MKQEIKEDGQGSLQDIFNKEAVQAPENVWQGIRKSLFSKSLKGYVYFALSIVLLGALSLTWNLNQESTAKTNIAKQSPTKGKNKSLIKGKNSSLVQNSKINSSKLISESDNTIQEKAERDDLTNEEKIEVITTSGFNGAKDSKVKSSINTIEEVELNIAETKIDEISNTLGLDLEQGISKMSLDSSMEILKLDPKNIFITQKNTNQQILPFKPSAFLSHKFSLSLCLVNGASFRTMKPPFNNTDISSRNFGEPKIHTTLNSVQLGMNYAIDNNFEFNTGIAYSDLHFQSPWSPKNLFLHPGEQDISFQTIDGPGRIIDPLILNDLQGGDTMYTQIRMNHSSSFMTIPLGMSYYFHVKNWSPFIRVGMNIALFNKSNLDIEVLNDDLPMRVLISTNNPPSHFAIQEYLSCGLEYHIKPTWSLYVEPRLTLPFINGPNSQSPPNRFKNLTIGAGLKIGL
jgi:hypothetical protein